MIFNTAKYGENTLARKSKKEEESLIDEIVELKFGKEAKNDPKKGRTIAEYLENLYIELIDVIDDDEEEEEEPKHRSPHFNKEMVSTINSDNNQDDMIPFVVVKKEKTAVDVKCPHCGGESKVFLSKFRGSQYDDYECSKCKKTSLIKLNFEPSLKTFIEKK